MLDGADVNAHSAFGMTPLMWASAGGYNEMVNMLIERGAKISTTTRHAIPHSAITLAANNGHTDTVKILRRALRAQGRADVKRILDAERRLLRRSQPNDQK